MNAWNPTSLYESGFERFERTIWKMSFEGGLAKRNIVLIESNTFFINTKGRIMSNIEIASVSTRGQIVIPNDIRKSLNIETGTKMVMIQDGDNILMKPIQKPARSEFSKLIKEGNRIRKEAGLTKEGI